MSETKAFDNMPSNPAGDGRVHTLGGKVQGVNVPPEKGEDSPAPLLIRLDSDGGLTKIEQHDKPEETPTIEVVLNKEGEVADMKEGVVREPEEKHDAPVEDSKVDDVPPFTEGTFSDEVIDKDDAGKHNKSKKSK